MLRGKVATLAAIIRIIIEDEPETQDEIASKLNISRRYVAKLLKPLIDEGVVRHPYIVNVNKLSEFDIYGDVDKPLDNIIKLYEKMGENVLYNLDKVFKALKTNDLEIARGIIFQDYKLIKEYTVEENIMAILETLKISKNERKKRLEEHLEELSLTKLAKQKAYTLSGGERRKLEITRSLVTSPSFLLMDEPFAGVDPLAVADIQDIIRKLKEKNIGILITDHNVLETLKITERAYIIFNGEILFSGTSRQLVNDEKAREVYLGDRFINPFGEER